jgi:hypothetical protein
MPGPDPTPEPKFWKDVRTLALVSAIVVLLGAVAYLLYK